MAKASKIIPPSILALELTTTEASTLREYLDLCSNPQHFRSNNHAIYDILNAVEDLIDLSRKDV